MKRLFNFLGSMRLDIPHLRMVESAINDEFDSLVGQMISGGASHVVKGLTISPSGIGGLASALVLDLAGAVVSHTNASEPGALLYFDPTEASVTLSSANSRVLGSFQASTTNYVGIDLVREVDSTTADTVKFIDATSKTEISRNIPLGRVLKYRVHINTNGFASSTNLLPIAKVVTNASNRVVSITDARPMMFGLYNGGDLVNANYKHIWANRDNQVSLTASTSSDPFSIGDKTLTSLKTWMDAVMTRLWEVGGGEAWYSNTSDRDVKVAYGANIIPATGQNFEWNLGTMKYIQYDAQTVNFTPGAELGQAGPTADIVSDIDDGTTGVLTVTNVIGTFLDNVAITDTSGGAAVANGTVITTSQNLRWRGIRILFSNSTASYNTVTDNIVGVTFPDDYVLYVDVDRENEGAAIVATAVPRDELGTATTPGSRFILAWRKGNDVFVRDHSYEVGRSFSVATTVAFGDLRVYNNDNEAFDPNFPEAITSKSFSSAYGVPKLDVTGEYVDGNTLGVDGSWIPKTNATYDLGTVTGPQQWRHIYLTGNGVFGGFINVGGSATVGGQFYVSHNPSSSATNQAVAVIEGTAAMVSGEYFLAVLDDGSNVMNLKNTYVASAYNRALLGLNGNILLDHEAASTAYTDATFYINNRGSINSYYQVIRDNATDVFSIKRNGAGVADLVLTGQANINGDLIVGADANIAGITTFQNSLHTSATSDIGQALARFGNAYLSNVSAQTVYPRTHNLYDLGQTGSRYKDAYLSGILYTDDATAIKTVWERPLILQSGSPAATLTTTTAHTSFTMDNTYKVHFNFPQVPVGATINKLYVYGYVYRGALGVSEVIIRVKQMIDDGTSLGSTVSEISCLKIQTDGTGTTGNKFFGTAHTGVTSTYTNANAGTNGRVVLYPDAGATPFVVNLPSTSSGGVMCGVIGEIEVTTSNASLGMNLMLVGVEYSFTDMNKA